MDDKKQQQATCKRKKVNDCDNIQQQPQSTESD